MSVQFYWIPGPLANYGTTENGFKGEVRVVSVADFQLVTHANEVQAQEIHSLRADIVDLIAEVARLQRLIQMANDTGDLYERKLDAHETAIGSLRSRLAEAEGERDLILIRAENAEAALVSTQARLDKAEALLREARMGVKNSAVQFGYPYTEYVDSIDAFLGDGAVQDEHTFTGHEQSESMDKEGRP